jgi:hypothetical protein
VFVGVGYKVGGDIISGAFSIIARITNGGVFGVLYVVGFIIVGCVL